MKRHSPQLVRRLMARTAFAALAGLAAVPAAHAQAAKAASDYPNRPIKLIVPHTAGGLVDIFARSLAQHLGAKLGQTVFVENRPGANQAIGTEAAARSAPDGYTLLLGTQTSLVFNPIVRKKLPYDPLRDFAPISMLFTTPFYLVVTPNLPVQSVKDLIGLARSKPGALTFASLGQGSSQHLAAEMFKTRAMVDMLHVPYRGSPESFIGLMSGQVDLTFDGGGTSLPNIRSGKVRALASTGTKRTQAMPELPTLSETIPGLDITVWFGLVAPAGTPQPIVDRLNRETIDMLRLPATQEKFAAMGVEIVSSTPDELGAKIRADLPVWKKIMTDAGIQPE